MTSEFSAAFWESHWEERGDDRALPPHPALETEIADLAPGAALEAGSGEGAEAVWLAERGWKVTAVDLSARALRRAGARFSDRSFAVPIEWLHADLTTWEPIHPFDLVTTFYAHPAMAQDAFYARLSRWVAPGGALLIVGHEEAGRLDAPRDAVHSHPSTAVTAPRRILSVLDEGEWTVSTADVRERAVGIPDGGTRMLRDVVVRATRRS
ncbi:class I SAM-dependent methyltransferase [Microbacterium sp. ABRD28]|uniref:SAM-dependent methyltransferase n=1 Tax=Microbacterium sp. ABRD28 TaxID=2268461 RepID=UPI000F557940|nr:class I SAM-dependent methyltransferase [Microbacterium sp. ABRD28]AZC13312.1 class I SAM-dependent methyltransferase [Microbacterium sp. ABRD28]